MITVNIKKQEGNDNLLKNATFGEDMEEFIPVDIKYEYLEDMWLLYIANI